MKPGDHLERFDRLIVESPLIKSYLIKKRRIRRFEAYIKIRLTLIDDSLLDVTEYIYAAEENNAQIKRYSYHWMDASTQLRVRWDNVPHYPDIPGYPHHRHEGDQKNVLPGESMSLVKVLDIIATRLKDSQANHFSS